MKSISGIYQLLKKNDFGTTLLHFKNYFLAEVAAKVLTIISIPVFTYLLTTVEYGIYNIFISYIQIFTVLLPLNSHASVSRYYFEKDKGDTKRFLGTSVSFSTLCITLTLPFFIIFQNELAAVFNMPVFLLWLMFPTILFQIAFSFFQQVYYPLEKSKALSKVNIVRAYSEFFVAIFIIYLLNTDLYLGPILAIIVIRAFQFIYIIKTLKPYFQLSFNYRHIKYILNYSVPLIPYTLSAVILDQFDRIMINSYSGNSEAGLYSMAYNIGMLLSVVIMVIFMAWTPNLMKYLNSANHEKRDKDLNKILRLIAFAAIGLIYFGKELGYILSEASYHDALPIIPVIVVGYIFYSIFRVYGIYAGYYKKTYLLSINLLIPSILNIILNAVYIPKYGYIAGAYTTVISFVLMALLSWFIAKYVLKEPNLTSWQILLPITINFVVFLLLYYIIIALNISLIISIVLKIFLLVLYTYISIKPFISETKKLLKK